MSSFFGFIGSLIQIAIFLLIVVGIIAFFGYNSLRALMENVKEAFSNIGVTSRKQISLTNQLIETVKGYADNEKFVHLQISSDVSVTGMAQAHQASGQMVTAISGMAQRFPDLKANEQYNMLMQAISNIEHDLEAQRERYNAAAKSYNVKRTSIPHIFYASTLGFKSAPYLDLASAETEDIGMLKTMNSDDSERINQLLGAAGSRTASALRAAGSKALEHSKVAVQAAQSKLKQMQTAEFTYLDGERNPQGPVDFDTLKALHAEGKIDATTSIMPAGAKAWMKYGEVLAAESEQATPV